MLMTDLSANLRRHLAQVFERPIDMAPLADKGLAHRHVRLIGTGLLARVTCPSSELPWGALLVEEITGSVANNPAHIGPIMQALASIHTLPVPAPENRPLPHLGDELAPRLISYDAHPGNFLITATGKAVLVDLEKLRYSHLSFACIHHVQEECHELTRLYAHAS